MNDGSGFQKRRQLLEMLDAGLVMLHLDPRPADVIVPARFKSDPVLRLNLAYQYRLPALDIGIEGVYAVLSFDKQNFGCTLPWSAIFAVTCPDANHDGIVWPESVPEELKASFTRAGVKEPSRLRAAPPASPLAVLPPTPLRAAPLAVVRPEASTPSDAVANIGGPSNETFQPPAADAGQPSGPSAADAGQPSGPSVEADVQPAARKRGHLTLIKG